MTSKKLRLFTAVWGDKHLEWFKEYCLKSLCGPLNSEALRGATWVFATKEEEQGRITEIVKASGLKIEGIEFIIFDKHFGTNPHAAGAYMNHALLNEMNACISLGAQSLTAPPDTIFGDGSINGLLVLGRQPNTVVFAAHVRVHPSISNAGHLSNAQLVSEAWRNLHKTWSEAEIGLEKINSYVGGVSWEYASENLYAVTHRLPTPYLINWTPEDYVYFRSQIHYGVLDHSWPAECLIETGRMRVAGSSDLAFMCEITEPENNIPPLAPYHDHEPDLFWRNLSHNKINRMFKIIFRGE